MTRPTSSKLRILERMAQAAQEYLARSPAIPTRQPVTEAAPLPPGLQRVVEQLALLEEALGQSAMNAAGVEKLLQTEAEALGTWVETLIRIKARLSAWAGEEQ
jgi:hypothetical protein